MDHNLIIIRGNLSYKYLKQTLSFDFKNARDFETHQEIKSQE